MKFIDLLANREEMFSMGIEALSGQHYVSFPVSLGVVDYEEYYAIDRATFERSSRTCPPRWRSSPAPDGASWIGC